MFRCLYPIELRYIILHLEKVQPIGCREGEANTTSRSEPASTLTIARTYIYGKALSFALFSRTST